MTGSQKEVSSGDLQLLIFLLQLQSRRDGDEHPHLFTESEKYCFLLTGSEHWKGAVAIEPL